MGEVQTTLLSKRWRVVGAGVLLVLLGIILHWTTAGQRDWPSGVVSARRNQRRA